MTIIIIIIKTYQINTVHWKIETESRWKKFRTLKDKLKYFCKNLGQFRAVLKIQDIPGQWAPWIKWWTKIRSKRQNNFLWGDFVPFLSLTKKKQIHKQIAYQKDSSRKDNLQISWNQYLILTKTSTWKKKLTLKLLKNQPIRIHTYPPISHKSFTKKLVA